jgi:hypothetical protein
MGRRSFIATSEGLEGGEVGKVVPLSYARCFFRRKVVAPQLPWWPLAARFEWFFTGASV